MDITILDSWLREYLKTKATNKEFAKFVSLSGPTIDRTKKYGDDYLYEIEVTTNRVDAMSVYGIAREASTILPIYNLEAKLEPIPQYKKKLPTKGPKLVLKSDPKLTSRLMGVVLEDIKNWKTPKWMHERLESAGMRSLNSVVDITNYVMHEIGHPCHVFDYDKIPNKKIVVRESINGETITSFDNKTYKLTGGDIVFDDGDGNIIDLPGIVGTKNSVVTKNTKRVLFFFDTNDPRRIRKTSMELAIRTNAAVLNEKGVDPELAEVALKRGLLLFEEVAKAKVASPIYDSYHKSYKAHQIETDTQFLEKILGTKISKKIINDILKNLGFKVKWSGNNIKVEVPSYRANDIKTPEDIVEEIARMYGYHNLPSKLMPGQLISEKPEEIFQKESKTREILTRLGGSEVYTFSLVGKEMLLNQNKAIKLSNPLGTDTEYLRDNLYSSLRQAIEVNNQSDRVFLFELSNVYLDNKNNLPREKQQLGAIFKGYTYRQAKGVLEALLDALNINFSDKKYSEEIFTEKTGLVFYDKENVFAKLGMLKNSEYIYFYSDFELLASAMREYPTYQPIPDFPPQIEDITIEILGEESVGELMQKLQNSHNNIAKVELIDIYKYKYTFRITYLDAKKTLTDKEVEEIRNKVINKLNLQIK